MNADEWDQLCTHYNMEALNMIINIRYYKKYRTVAALHQLNDTMLEKFKTLLEPNSNIVWPKEIEPYGFIDYVAIGQIPHGAMALYKLGYRVNQEYPPTIHGTNMHMHYYHPDKRSISYDVIEDRNAFTTLWYKLLAIEINDQLLGMY